MDSDSCNDTEIISQREALDVAAESIGSQIELVAEVIKMDSNEFIEKKFSAFENSFQMLMNTVAQLKADSDKRLSSIEANVSALVQNHHATAEKVVGMENKLVKNFKMQELQNVKNSTPKAHVAVTNVLKPNRNKGGSGRHVGSERGEGKSSSLPTIRKEESP